MNEDAPVNSAGDGSRVALPPAHVIVGKRSRTKYRKNSDRKYDGRTKAGRKLVSRVLLNRNKKMSEELTKLTEAPTETERAQKQIAQQKKLKKEEFIMENDVLTVATQLAAGEIGDTQGFADVTVGDKTIKMDEYSAKKTVAVHQALDPANQIKFQQMLNQSPETYLAALDFAVRQN